MMGLSNFALPLRFGPRNLFGLYHAPSPDALRGAVLLCPPIGLDQIRSHRLYRQLAHALVGEGYAALRFDCYGTGDSPGDSMDVDWLQCVDDTSHAAAELRRLSGCAKIAAFGARLGGSLALAVAGPARLARLVVWDPVLDGRAYAAQQDDCQELLRQDLGRFRMPRPAADATGQWLGFAVSPTLRAQLAALRAVVADVPTLVLQSAGGAEDTELTRLLAAGAQCRRLRDAPTWDDLARLETTVLAPDVVQAACAHLRETY